MEKNKETSTKNNSLGDSERKEIALRVLKDRLHDMDHEAMRIQVSRKLRFSKDLYDEKTATLRLFGKEIKLPKSKNEDQFCRIIFAKEKNMKKEWQSVDLIEASRGLIHPKHSGSTIELWRPVYVAVQSINNRISKKLLITDFFLTRPVTTVKINPKHLD